MRVKSNGGGGGGGGFGLAPPGTSVFAGSSWLECLFTDHLCFFELQ